LAINASEHADGSISVLHPLEWFNAAVDGAGVHVAVADDGTIAGFIAVTPPPTRSGVARHRSSWPCSSLPNWRTYSLSMMDCTFTEPHPLALSYPVAAVQQASFGK